MDGTGWKGKKIIGSREVTCVCDLLVGKKKKKKNGLGKATQPEKRKSSGRASGKKAGWMRRGERSDWPIRTGERREMRRGRNGGKEELGAPTRDPACMNRFGRGYSGQFPPLFPVSYFKPSLGKPSMIFPLPITPQKSRNLALKLDEPVCYVRWVSVQIL